MEVENKTKEQLINELKELRKQITELKTSETERKRAEEALQEAEERYHALFKQAADSIVLIDGETGELVEFNQGAHEALGYTLEEFAKLKIPDFEIIETSEEVEKHIKKIIKEGTDAFETKHRTKGGEIRDIQVSSRVILIRGKNFIQSIWRDITERKWAEERIRKLGRLKEELLSSGSFHEKLKQITNVVVEILHADFSRIWITKPGDLCDSGCMHAEITEGPHVCRYRDRCLHLIASSGRYTHTDGKVHRRVPFGCYKIGRVAAGEDPKFITNDVTNDPRVHDHDWAKKLDLISFAGYRLLSEVSKPIGVLALFSKRVISPDEDALLDDIANTTAQVIQTTAAEEELKKTKDYLDNIIESSLDSIVVSDSMGYITSVNNSFLKLIGYNEEELIGKHISEFTPYEERAYDSTTGEMVGIDEKFIVDATEITGNKLFEEGKISNWDSYYLRKDGKIVPVESNIAYLYNDEGETIGAIGVSRDITERRQIEKALRESHQELEEKVEKRTATLKLTNEQLQQEIISRKQAEDKLRDSEERARSLLNAPVDIALLVDNKYKILDCNESLIKRFIAY